MLNNETYNKERMKSNQNKSEFRENKTGIVGQDLTIRTQELQDNLGCTDMDKFTV